MLMFLMLLSWSLTLLWMYLYHLQKSMYQQSVLMYQERVEVLEFLRSEYLLLQLKCRSLEEKDSARNLALDWDLQ